MYKAIEARKKILEFLPTRLRSIVNQLDKSYSDIEKELGVGRSTLSSYINAQALPSLEVLYMLSEEFGESVDYLLGKTEKSGSFMANEEASKYNASSSRVYLEEIKKLSGENAILKFQLEECQKNLKK
jgi:transcriptional regulator with XRE-family HTH domain